MGTPKRQKNGEWEKNRRKKLNLTFLELSELLPGHDSTILLSKVEVLKRAIAHIIDLKKKIADLVGEKCSETLQKEMESIKKQLSDLRERNRQLADLLASQNTDKSSDNDMEEDNKLKKISNLVKSLKEKLPSKSKKVPKAKKATKKKTNVGKPLQEKKTNTIVKCPKASKLSIEVNRIKENLSKAGLISSHPSTLPCTSISLVLSYPKTSMMTMAKSAPIMATGIQPVLKCSSGLSALGPGTLIMPDGRIVPVPPPPIIVNRPTVPPAVIVMQNIPTVNPQAPPKPNLQSRPIAPKKKDITKTTYVVKVPIPTISADKNVSSILANSKNYIKALEGKKKNANEKQNTKKKPVKLIKTVKAASLAGNESKSNAQIASQKNTNTEEEKVTSTKQTPQTEKTSQTSPPTELPFNTGKRKLCDKEASEQSKRQKIDDKNASSSVIENSVSLDPSTISVTPIQTPSVINSHTKNKDLDGTSNVPSTLSSNKSSTVQLVSSGLTVTSNISLDQDQGNNKLSEGDQMHKENRVTEVQISNANMCLNGADITTTSINQSTIQGPLKDQSLNNVLLERPEQQNESVNRVENNLSCSENKSVQAASQNINTSIESNVKCNESSGIATKESSQEVLNKSSSLNEKPKAGNNSGEDSLQSNSKIDSLRSTDIQVKKKNIVESKTIIQDENQELSGFFSSDSKLQTCSDFPFRDTDFRDRNLFMPINNSYVDEVRLSLPHADFSNDLFSSLQVPTGGQHPESISPTAAFLLAFPLVSTSKASELMTENDVESQHGTPTTILQIGNIDPPGNDLFHQSSLIIENNVTANLEDSVKANKSTELTKPNNGKAIKEVQTLGKFQNLDDLTRSGNFPKQCKEKKVSYPSHQDQQTYISCKKKSSERNYNNSLPTEIIPPNFQDKSYDYSLSNTKQISGQNPLSSSGIENQKKCQNSENFINSNNNYSGTSQGCNYSSYSNSNDFSLPPVNYFPSNQLAGTLKTSQTNTNFNASTWSSSFPVTSSWSTSVISTVSGGIPSNYCTYPQRTYEGKQLQQKSTHGNFEDLGVKEKSVASNNGLPKFSSNFNFNNHRSNQESHVYHNQSQQNSMNCKIEPKMKKQKTTSQRGPVNWMTTPDVRPVLPDPNLLPVLPEVMFHAQKELDFNSVSGNPVINSSNNITSFNMSTSSTVPTNSQTLHHNSHFTSGGIEFQLDFASFPEMACSTKPSKSLSSITSNQHNPQHYSLSPSKSGLPLLPHIESHMIPSTLPTLVGDLALGTTTPMDPFKTINMPTNSFSMDTSNKKCDNKMESQKTNEGKSQEKDCFVNSDRKHVSRNMTDFYQKGQAHQSTNTTSSFLSVSQLVDPVKSEQTTSRRGAKQNLNKNSSSNGNIQKRNQQEKQTHSKVANNITMTNNCHSSSIGPAVPNSRKPENYSNYQDRQSTNLPFTGSFSNNMGPPPWQSNKTHRQYKGSYSAESLIGEHSAPVQEQISELPIFSIANQYAHPPMVSSSSFTNSDFSHQNMQPLEFHQPHHSTQNCLNFPTHNSHYSSASFNSESDYAGLDSLYSLNSLSNRSISHTDGKSNRNKRNLSSKRKDEFSSNQLFNQPSHSYHPGRSKGTSTSSPNHPGTTSLTNFNLSTIFPEINDKRAIQAPNSFHSGSSSNKHGDSSARPTIRSEYSVTHFNHSQMQQTGVPATPQFPSSTFANLGPPIANFRPQ